MMSKIADVAAKELKTSREGFCMKAKTSEPVDHSISTMHVGSRNTTHGKSLNKTAAPLYESTGESTYSNQERTRDTIRNNQMTQAKSLLGRSLGGLEVMYHHTMSKGMDMICLMTKLSTTFPINAQLARKALHHLAQRHPLLRMTIHCTEDGSSDKISFLEMEDERLDFAASSESDNWLPFLMAEVAEPFDIVNGPLWKCRLLTPKNSAACPIGMMYNEQKRTNHNARHTDNPQNDFIHESRFLFVLHHSIMDGGYVIWVFKDFAELLDKVYTGDNIENCLSKTLPPPLEHVLQCPVDHTMKSSITAADVLPSLYLDVSEPSDKVLSDYNHKFSYEIQRHLSRPPRNECLVFEFSEQETEKIARMCKIEEVSPNGIFIATSILAFIDLVYSRSPRKHYVVPFEFMMDLRRHVPMKISDGSKKCIEGVASIHVPMTADIKLSSRPVTKLEFWQMSRSLGRSAQSEIHSPEVFQWIHKTVRQSFVHSKRHKPVGKASHVLCLSNMGRLDGVLTGDIAKRMKLTGLHGHPTVLNDDSPIFFVSNFSLNGKLCGNVSFCENYTSRETAAEYIGHIKKYFLAHAKL